MAFAYLRVKRPQSSTVVGAQRVQDPRPRVESQNKIPLGVLKSARARLATNLKRSRRRVSCRLRSEAKSEAKRTRTEGERRARNHVIPGVPSNRSPAEPEVKKEPNLSLASYQSSSRSRLEPTTKRRQQKPLLDGNLRFDNTSAPSAITLSVRVSMAEERVQLLQPVRLGGSSQGSKSEFGSTTTVPSARTTTTSSPARSVRFSTDFVPETIPARALPSSSATAPLQEEPRIKLEKPAVLAVPPSATASAQKMKAKSPTTTSTSVLSMKPSSSRAQKMTERARTAGTSKVGKPVEPRPSARTSQEASHPLLQQSTSVPSPAVKPATFSLTSSAAPEARNGYQQSEKASGPKTID
ncbi:hypothetical protein GQ600_15754 [Phytophthora cactorum]|nr:hypothetical protein GQ600_15754 [Phytophthora cactorum]